MDYYQNFTFIATSIAVGSILFVVVQKVKLKSKVPGPWLSRWTHYAYIWHVVRAKGPDYVHAMHQKYGPIVRITPSWVSVSDLDEVKRIYTVKESFKKSPWYQDVAPTDHDNIFNTINVATHRRHRRLLAGPMSESSLKVMIPGIIERVRLAIDKMAEEMQLRGAIDVFKWWLFLTTDTIGDLSFGSSFEMLEHGTENQYTTDLKILSKLGAITVTFPKLLKLAAYLPIPLPLISTVSAANRRTRQYAITSLKRLKQTDRETLFSNILKATEHDKLTFDEVISNAQAYIIAGSDTTSTTMTYLVWAVCSHPSVHERLINELQKLPKAFSEEDTRRLIYLDQVIRETLRLYGPAPALLPRVVPPGGASICGFALDAGTTIGAQSYTLHRDPEIFPNPEEYDPGRWGEPTKAMKDAFMPFGRGSRVCIGIHLALIEIRLAAVMFFQAFPYAKMSTKEGMSAADMKPLNLFLASPTGGRCLVEG